MLQGTREQRSQVHRVGGPWPAGQGGSGMGCEAHPKQHLLRLEMPGSCGLFYEPPIDVSDASLQKHVSWWVCGKVRCTQDWLKCQSRCFCHPLFPLRVWQMLVRAVQLDASRDFHHRGLRRSKFWAHSLRLWDVVQGLCDKRKRIASAQWVTHARPCVCYFTNEALCPEPGLQSSCNSVLLTQNRTWLHTLHANVDINLTGPLFHRCGPEPTEVTGFPPRPQLVCGRVRMKAFSCLLMLPPPPPILNIWTCKTASISSGWRHPYTSWAPNMYTAR